MGGAEVRRGGAGAAQPTGNGTAGERPNLSQAMAVLLFLYWEPLERGYGAGGVSSTVTLRAGRVVTGSV
jgi:hypothetical protein